MGFWQKVKRAFVVPPVERPPDPEQPMPGDEVWLRALLERLGEREAAALAAVRDGQAWAAIDRLLQSGRERTALELLGRVVHACPDERELAAHLAELLCDRRDDAAARPLLTDLASRGTDAGGLRARFLLAELNERAGDGEAARREYEAILAVDLDYPRARAGAERLRRRRDKPSAGSSAATVAGLPESGALAGRYRLVRELGRGASGAVYVARDDELERELAIKILHPHARAADRAEIRARAWAEARISASMRHPGVVAILDLDEDRQMLAMELCRGGPLRDILLGGPLLPAAALARAVEIFDVLAAIHSRGIVHGDVKPANLLLRSEHGSLVLTDFGVARLVGEKPVVDDRCARGTLAYMSPEQRRGELSPAADVYAAGVLTVELAAGTHALSSWLGDRGALLRGQAAWDGKLPEALAAHVGERAAELTALVASFLAADLAKRPTAAEAATKLRALC
jgi:hypothetical protein